MQEIKYEDIVMNIKGIIERKGLKQRAIAKKIGMTEQHLSNMLNLKKKIRAEHIPLIANALEVEVNEIFDIKKG